MGCIKRKLNAVRFISRQVACGGVENGGSVFIAEAGFYSIIAGT